MSEDPSHRNIYLKSFLWAIPACFVGTIVVTAIAFVVASADDGVDLSGSALGGIFWGALIFLPSCLISVPIVGFTTASCRLFAADRRQRREGNAPLKPIAVLRISTHPWTRWTRQNPDSG